MSHHTPHIESSISNIISKQRRTTGAKAVKGTELILPHRKKRIDALLIFLASKAKLVVIPTKPVTYHYAYG